MQATEEEKQRYGWVMKREVRWNSLHVKIHQKMFAELKKELREVESEMEVSYCEPEQGPLLGEDYEAKKERPIESLMNSVKNTDLLLEEMTVRLNETKVSYVFETDDLFVITGFVADDGQSFETVLKFDEVIYDEESLSNEETSEVLQQKELIDEFLDGGKQSIKDDLKMKTEKEMCKEIFIGKNQNCILMKEKVEQSPWIVMKSEEKEDVLSKIRIAEYNFVIVKYDMVSYEECMQSVYQTIEEIGDGES